MIRLLLALLVAALIAHPTRAAEMRMAVTTSFNNSGLSDVLLPEIEKDLGIVVRLLVVGTGQALKLGRAGDVDALLVHSKADEERFVAGGYAPYRREIMYNDFVIVGPDDDPAGVSQSATAADAFSAIEASRTSFVSRGDESGTHKKETEIWRQAGFEPERLEAEWYREAGAGMGAALNTASGMNAYILSDRASWLKFGNKGRLKLLFSGDPHLFNQYAYLPVDPQRHPHVRSDLARQVGDWLSGDKGQALIAAYTLNGEALFTPNAVNP